MSESNYHRKRAKGGRLVGGGGALRSIHVSSKTSKLLGKVLSYPSMWALENAARDNGRSVIAELAETWLKHGSEERFVPEYSNQELRRPDSISMTPDMAAASVAVKIKSKGWEAHSKEAFEHRDGNTPMSRSEFSALREKESSESNAKPLSYVTLSGLKAQYCDAADDAAFDAADDVHPATKRVLRRDAEEATRKRFFEQGPRAEDDSAKVDEAIRGAEQLYEQVVSESMNQEVSKEVELVKPPKAHKAERGTNPWAGQSKSATERLSQGKAVLQEVASKQTEERPGARLQRIAKETAAKIEQEIKEREEEELKNMRPELFQDEMMIGLLKLGGRAESVLNKHGYHTIGQLRAADMEEIRALKGVGDKVLYRIVACLYPDALEEEKSRQKEQQVPDRVSLFDEDEQDDVEDGLE